MYHEIKDLLLHVLHIRKSVVNIESFNTISHYRKHPATLLPFLSLTHTYTRAPPLSLDSYENRKSYTEF